MIHLLPVTLGFPKRDLFWKFSKGGYNLFLLTWNEEPDSVILLLIGGATDKISKKKLMSYQNPFSNAILENKHLGVAVFYTYNDIWQYLYPDCFFANAPQRKSTSKFLIKNDFEIDRNMYIQSKEESQVNFWYITCIAQSPGQICSSSRQWSRMIYIQCEMYNTW
jgi:hypothetical protein